MGSGESKEPLPDGPISFSQLLKTDREKTADLILKHYSDQFSYHAAQRLTTFRYFITAFSVFSAAYATLLTSSDPLFHDAAFGIAAFAFLLVLCFARLDKRNEQIILLNEHPIRLSQREIDAFVGGDGDYSTFDKSDAEKRFFMTFGRVLPVVFLLTAILSIAGMYVASKASNSLPFAPGVCLWVGASVAAVIAVYVPFSYQKSSVTSESASAAINSY